MTPNERVWLARPRDSPYLPALVAACLGVGRLHQVLVADQPARLPAIAGLRRHCDVPAPNAIRQAQRLLAGEGLLEPRQGLGVFVTAATPRATSQQVLVELKAARAARSPSSSVPTRAADRG